MPPSNNHRISVLFEINERRSSIIQVHTLHVYIPVLYLLLCLFSLMCVRVAVSHVMYILCKISISVIYYFEYLHT